MEQKQVKLIGLKIENSGIIKAAALTPDILNKKLIRIQGSMGNGKSTLMDAWKTSLSGTDAIKKKDILESGYIAEAQLSDGEIPVYVGARVREKKSGDKKLETFIYSKTKEGKIDTKPIIDGEVATAASYMKLLTTELTFNMPALFSENQTAHRGLIEKLFKAELDKAGATEVIARIEIARKARDTARALSDANGAKMTIFEEEGWNKASLDTLEYKDVPSMQAELMSLTVKKDRIVNSSKIEADLKHSNALLEKNKQLQAIKDKGLKIKEEIRIKLSKDQAIYDIHTQEQQKLIERKQYIDMQRSQIYGILRDILGTESTLASNVNSALKERSESITVTTIPSPVECPILHSQLQATYKEYEQINNTQIANEDPESIDTTSIDRQISDITNEITRATVTNKILARYQLWSDWIEKDGIYKREIDTLRSLYASINTGIAGLSIIPRESESGRIEIWLMYNGAYDPKFFGNEKQEYRFLFGGDKSYSSFQRSIIGLMLQSARLNLKPKALRLAFLDDVAFDTSGLTILAKIAEEFKVQLVVAWTHEIDTDNLDDGQIAIEGGEIFFKSND